MPLVTSAHDFVEDVGDFQLPPIPVSPVRSDIYIFMVMVQSMMPHLLHNSDIQLPCTSETSCIDYACSVGPTANRDLFHIGRPHVFREGLHLDLCGAAVVTTRSNQETQNSLYKKSTN